ncbi:MAG TPA: 2Fe-2S iron-sulfur cluster-binding protein [Candidatus Dormibacteraeota bacterium]
MTRLPIGGRIDRSRPVRFTFNGHVYQGFAGDTLASALLANDVRVVAKSVTYGRPRGIFSAGVEEPNALVRVGPEPMLRATQVELVDGLEATGLNGKGRLTAQPESGRFDKVYAHCEVLVVGGGPTGRTAAHAAAQKGDRVILLDEQANPSLDDFGGLPANARVLLRTTAFGLYEQNLVLAAERRDGGGRLWQIRAREVVLATGAHERPIVFANNDRPGIMLASAVRTYVNRYGVAPGTRAVIFTNNSSTDVVAADLKSAGIVVEAIVDVRAGEAVVDTLAESSPDPPSPLVGEGRGGGSLKSVIIAPLTGGASREVECDLLCVSGGFNPTAHLYSQAQGKLRYDERFACFRPDGKLPNVTVLGAANAEFDFSIQPLWLVPGRDGNWSTHFVDLERDVTVVEMQRAVGAGMRSVEHVKRFTTIGTGSDQGKTSGINEVALVGTLTGQPIGGVGTTTYRPPYVPVSFALMAGRNRSDLFDPIRLTSIHSWHVGHGAVFENVGQWKRPWYFPRHDEDMEAAVLRECRAARENVAVMDASTLGKVDIQGPDALEFLNRMYTNAFDSLKVGSCRYGLMCRADGMVFDDGVVMHLGPDHWLATTTTGGAAAVLDWMEEWLQTEWPDLRVRLTSVTDHWSDVAVVGPRSRDVVRTLFPNLELGPESFPFMAIREGETGGIPVRLHRITFSGELAYELWTPSWYGLALWEAVMAAGEPLGITPYGTEAMHVLRAEKGYVICGQETDGTVTPQDLGMSWIVSKKKAFIGQRSHRRSDTARADRKHLVGLLPIDGEELLPEGAQLVLEQNGPAGVKMVGHVTSSYRSATLGRTFALAMLQSGRERFESTVYAPLNGHVVAATVTEPIFYDKENVRRDS